MRRRERTPAGDEHVHGLGGGGDGGAGCEDDYGDEEDLLPAKDVGEPAAEGQDGGAGEVVCGRDPYEGVGAVEVVDDRRQRSRHRGL